MKQQKHNTLFRLLAALMCLMAVTALCACQPKSAEGLWADALYTKDTELGSGSVTVTAEVEVEDKTVRFTVHTDASTVGDALQGAGILEGEAGPYGLYIKRVNGMLADYDVDQTYWAFYIGSDYGMTGVDLTPIADGEIYRFVYSK